MSESRKILVVEYLYKGLVELRSSNNASEKSPSEEPTDFADYPEKNTLDAFFASASLALLAELRGGKLSPKISSQDIENCLSPLSRHSYLSHYYYYLQHLKHIDKQPLMTTQQEDIQKAIIQYCTDNEHAFDKLIFDTAGLFAYGTYEKNFSIDMKTFEPYQLLNKEEQEKIELIGTYVKNKLFPKLMRGEQFLINPTNNADVQPEESLAAVAEPDIQQVQPEKTATKHAAAHSRRLCNYEALFEKFKISPANFENVIAAKAQSLFGEGPSLLAPITSIFDLFFNASEGDNKHEDKEAQLSEELDAFIILKLNKEEITAGNSSLNNEALFRTSLLELNQVYLFLEKINQVSKELCSDAAFKHFRHSIVAMVQLVSKQLAAAGAGAKKRRKKFLNFMINHPIIAKHRDEILGWGRTRAMSLLEEERDGNGSRLTKLFGVFSQEPSSSSTNKPSVEPKRFGW